VRDRDAWLRRLRRAERSASSLSAYRYAIDDLLAWAERTERTGELFESAVTRRRRPTTAASFCWGASWAG